jgi:hypothetical protein
LRAIGVVDPATLSTRADGRPAAGAALGHPSDQCQRRLKRSTVRAIGAEPPPLEAVDVYLYAHGNGAIFLYHPDARSRFVVLSEALEVARDCGSAGGRVFLGGDAGKQMADHVLAAIRRTGTPVVDYVPPVKPYQWDL